MTAAQTVPDASTEARRRWMGILAKAPVARLEATWTMLPEAPAYTLLRPAEIGSALVRARAGGTGARFNLGEMTLTRCAVRLDGTPPRTGFGYVAGRDKRHAELAAVFDALLQDPARAEALEGALLAPLAEAQEAARTARSREAAATRVDFFTLVRGED